MKTPKALKSKTVNVFDIGVCACVAIVCCLGDWKEAAMAIVALFVYGHARQELNDRDKPPHHTNGKGVPHDERIPRR